MENISLPPLLNDEIAKMAIKELLQFAKEEVRKEMEAEQLPINQKTLCKKFGFDRDNMYDLKDVYEIFEQLKEIEQC